MFHRKCYICENKSASSFQIEHLRPHKRNADLKYDWNNLFWSCAHCNNLKNAGYEPILDYSQVDVEAEEYDKEDLRYLIRAEVSTGSSFTAFKRWLLWDHKDRYGEVL